MTNQNSKLQCKIKNFLKAKSYKLKADDGFTLLETLVALAILTTGITASLTLVAQSLKSISYFQNQTTAFYLAIEGIEFTRNRRDENFISGIDWLTGLDDCILTDGCYVDVKNKTIDQCPPAGCPKITYNSQNNLYSYQTPCNPPDCQTTIFTRKIRIFNIVGADYEKKLISEVSWQERYGAQNFTLEEHIFNWR